MARLIQINQMTGLLLQADFTKILEKIDGLVELLKQESEDDKSKKTFLGFPFLLLAAFLSFFLWTPHMMGWLGVVKGTKTIILRLKESYQFKVVVNC